MVESTSGLSFIVTYLISQASKKFNNSLKLPVVSLPTISTNFRGVLPTCLANFQEVVVEKSIQPILVSSKKYQLTNQPPLKVRLRGPDLEKFV